MVEQVINEVLHRCYPVQYDALVNLLLPFAVGWILGYLTADE